MSEGPLIGKERRIIVNEKNKLINECDSKIESNRQIFHSQVALRQTVCLSCSAV